MEILPGTVSKQARWAGEAPVGVGACVQQPGVGKLVRVVEGGKLHRRGGKTHFSHELKTNMVAGRSSSTAQ
jgi:hypothetical protein